MKEKVWVITYEFNAYDQLGEYFGKVFKNKPTHQQCLDFLLKESYTYKWQATEHKDKMVEKLLNGGGRAGTEDVWYILREEELK